MERRAWQSSRIRVNLGAWRWVQAGVPVLLPRYFEMTVDQSVKGTARPPRTTVGMTWLKPL